MLTFGPIAQLDRALDYESRCREFESLLGHQRKAQSVDCAFLLSDERLWGGNKNFPLKRLLNRGCRDSRESRGGGAAGFHEAAPF